MTAKVGQVRQWNSAGDVFLITQIGKHAHLRNEEIVVYIEEGQQWTDTRDWVEAHSTVVSDV